jgi:hypothetical protein
MVEKWSLDGGVPPPKPQIATLCWKKANSLNIYLMDDGVHNVDSHLQSGVAWDFFNKSVLFRKARNEQ